MRVVNFCLQYFSCLSIVVLVGGAPMEKAIGEVVLSPPHSPFVAKEAQQSLPLVAPIPKKIFSLFDNEEL